MIYDLAIIGGGPAGVAAGVYAARKKLRTIFITSDFNSQSVVSDDIQNWIGTVSIRGEDLAKSLQAHLEAYASDVLDIKIGEKAVDIQKEEWGFKIKTDASENSPEYRAKTVLIATGGQRRKLGVPGAAEFEHRGVTYCASCDGPLFAGQDVVVIGGGNAGFETAAQLLAYAKSVTLLHKNKEFKADAITVEKVLSHPNMRAIISAEPTKIIGEKFASGIVYKNLETGEETTLSATGIFVEIGLIPATSFAKDVAKLNEYGQIVVDPRTQASSTSGIWAAGDCTDGLYHQNNIAAGDAVKALEDIYLHLNAE
ncbi:MAG: FAD-dependent oxidoreductase [Patescibacteria group bacterium]